jgi:hypothetical protein
MFTNEEIQKAKLQPNFEVEFALQWGSAAIRTIPITIPERIRCIWIGTQLGRGLAAKARVVQS